MNFTNPELAALPVSANTSPPDMRPVICDRRGPMPQEDDAPAVAEIGGVHEVGPGLELRVVRDPPLEGDAVVRRAAR